MSTGNTLAGRPVRAQGHELKARAGAQLLELLQIEGLSVRAAYRSGEVCRLLRMSPTTLRFFCELAEQSAQDPRALDSFRVRSHYRIAHTSLVEWLIRNQSFSGLHSPF